MLDLINQYASDGIMLPRTELEISENIRDFSVVSDGSQLMACGALHFYTPTSGEIRSIAVDPNAKNRGIGRTVVQALEKEANDCELETLFAFTYVPGFFSKLGYMEVDRSELPLKVWNDCMRCPKRLCCDELAMIKYLHGRNAAIEACRRESTTEQLIQIAFQSYYPLLKNSRLIFLHSHCSGPNCTST